jgi:hypothetical protein
MSNQQYILNKDTPEGELLWQVGNVRIDLRDFPTVAAAFFRQYPYFIKYFSLAPSPKGKKGKVKETNESI